MIEQKELEKIKDFYSYIKDLVISNMTLDEVFKVIEDKESILDKLMEWETVEWIYDNIYGKDLEDLQDLVLDNMQDLSKRQIRNLSDNLIDYHNLCVLPTDNLNDLAKAEFILENWDKIKIENINI